MRRFIPALCVATASLLAPSLLNAQQTKILTAEKHNEYGLVYTLPVTTLKIDVTAKRTVSKAGPYFQYAKKFLGNDRAIQSDSEQWEITDVRVTPYGVPDMEARYLMQLKPGAVTWICVDRDGMLLAINARVDAQELPDAPGDEKGNAPDEREYLKYVGEDFLASQSSAKQAQMLAESLMEIRDSRISLTRGTAETMPTDGRQLELMLQELARQEAAITGAFTGFTYSETVVRSFTFTPEEDGKQVLFRMSDFAGFCRPDDYAGDPVYISVNIEKRGEIPVDAKGEEKKLPKDAVIYNLPGTARVTIGLGDRTLYQRSSEYSQFGVRFGLNPTLFSDKKMRSMATFDPATGALLEIGPADESE